MLHDIIVCVLTTSFLLQYVNRFLSQFLFGSRLIPKKIKPILFIALSSFSSPFLSKSQSQGTTHSPISFNFYHGLCGIDTSSLCRCCLGLCRLKIFRYGGRVKIVKFDSLGTDNVLLNNNKVVA